MQTLQFNYYDIVLRRESVELNVYVSKDIVAVPTFQMSGVIYQIGKNCFFWHVYNRNFWNVVNCICAVQKKARKGFLSR